MAFSFSRDDHSISKSVRKLVRKRLEASRNLMLDPNRAQGEKVRELRKNVKKTRALLRLVEPHFKAFAAEDTALRDAARLISDLRDADALALTFDRVARHTHLPATTLAALRETIVTPSHAPDAAEAETLLKEHLAAIVAVENRIKGWKIAAHGFDAMSDGLEKTWTAAQKAMRRALAEPTGDHLHAWRKRVKDHWYHARLLAPIWPEMMAHHVAAADTLGETLGEARDLALLIAALGDRPDAGEMAAAAVEDEQSLLTNAGALGARFLSEPAAGLARRWRGWWDIWRD
ncbi:MAG: CHAD domain-containing protein [Rhodobacteraceae bacterium]|nr:CHAD domain-containing protein [Paracoccaceae bacterium]